MTTASSTNKNFLARAFNGRDLLASVVVFLVALPLCMGVALASGVPPALGLVTGIVGGIVIGSIAGSPLQVSGPAAGLAVLVWELVQTYGIAMLGVAVLLGGLLQVLAGTFKLGRWFRAVSPAVIQGMLAGIGVLIFASQFHVMVDDVPQGSGLTNLITIPGAISKGIFPVDGSSHHIAAIIGLLTIVTIVGWNFIKPKRLHMVPGPLLAIVITSVVAGVGGLAISYVSVPVSLSGALNVPTLSSFKMLITNGSFLATSVALAFIASAETLLCATAVDRLHNGERTDYDKELFAQGIGNMICGAVGALPATGVIVRSSANVEAGAEGRASAIYHGIWLLALIGLAPFILAWIPTSALAAILVYIGYRLVNFKEMKALWVNGGRSEFAIYAATVFIIVAADLLTGVLAGLVLSLLKFVKTFSSLEIKVEHGESETGQARADVFIEGAATFVRLPVLAESLERLPAGAEIHLHIGRLAFIDHACHDALESWLEQYKLRGGVVITEWDELSRRRDPKSVYASTKDKALSLDTQPSAPLAEAA